MTSLVLDNADFKKMPYASTTVHWTKTKGEIEGKIYELREKGLLKKHAWTTEGEAEKEIETLYMVLELPIADVALRTINLKFQPVMIYRKKKNRHREEVITLEKNVSWRLFWWHFKTKLEAVLYGLVTLENEFMANIMHYLPDGSGGQKEVTMAEALKMILLEDRVGVLLEDKRDPAAAKHVEPQ